MREPPDYSVLMSGICQY